MIGIWLVLFITGLSALFFARWELALVSWATLVLALSPPLLAARWSLSLPLPFLLATTLFCIASIFLGEAFDFYERFWWWDLVLHGSSAIGIGLCGFLFVFMLFEGDSFAAPPSAIAFMTFCVAMTTGALWEVFEFLMDSFFGLNMQKSGLPDTMEDMMLNAVGGILAAVAGYIFMTRPHPGLLGGVIGRFIEMNARRYQKFRNRRR